ncbi:MAG: ribonuclease PH [Chlamydiota bacterium]|nr:ribonuclease PH [Chlamydiota bacterium]
MKNPLNIRPIKITPHYIKHSPGSVLYECGNTRVICAATIQHDIPKWLKGKNQGWITAEYSMLPYASTERTMRESTKGKLNGRTQEIQRLIGRSLRGVVNLKALGERTIWIDCDVLSADGGTRTASISGGFIALSLAINKLIKENALSESPIKEAVAAISIGIVDGNPVVDLCYEEDVRAEVDMNIVMTESGRLIEIQGTAEHAPFTEAQLKKMLSLAKKSIKKIIQCQGKIINAR